ncbi:NAD(P)-dependent malic enzyme [Viridibacillus arvi]|uniref:NAD(P)-dependent malic enzyme n=1 Tax=Viridibacillus arvi TaxID=263475 RepID=UPI00187B7EE3|nr:malic enzyme-like NAD(P)-binding protein [Viridibacillus sp. JNUCC-6]QOV09435.1 NAD-dependent malic enzyme [Viridibacillus sp. JNUCC-6]
MSELKNNALAMHKKNRGKIEMISKVEINTIDDLSLAYSPGVAAPCMEIANDPTAVYDYTAKGNLVAVVTDGTAVLGLGNIGPEAALPVMEGKAILFKKMANIDAVPICLDTTDVDEIVRIVKGISPTFGGINLEDIAAPRCFEIEEKLRKECSIPVFHDDQHGTAIVVGAGLSNALKVINKDKSTVRIVINGAGAAGVAILKILKQIGYEHIIICDSTGIIYEGRENGMNSVKHELAKVTNSEGRKGSLSEALIGADIFIGVSVANILDEEMIQSMNHDPIIFALANPNPEVSYENAMRWGVRIFATGRSDYPNQVNNMLAFPGIFRGALDVHASEINEEMKLAAVFAIASLIDENDLAQGTIIPDALDERVAPIVAKAVSEVAIKTGVAKKPVAIKNK